VAEAREMMSFPAPPKTFRREEEPWNRVEAVLPRTTWEMPADAAVDPRETAEPPASERTGTREILEKKESVRLEAEVIPSVSVPVPPTIESVRVAGRIPSPSEEGNWLDWSVKGSRDEEIDAGRRLAGKRPRGRVEGSWVLERVAGRRLAGRSDAWRLATI